MDSLDLKASLGPRVKQFRDACGMTQEALAEAIEKSVEAVSKFERGHTLPGLDTLDRIARALRIPLVDLLIEERLPTDDRRAVLVVRAERILAGLEADQLEAALLVLEVIARRGK